MFYFQLFKFWPAFLSWMQREKKQISSKHRCQGWWELGSGVSVSFYYNSCLYILIIANNHNIYVKGSSTYFFISNIWLIIHPCLAQGHFNTTHWLFQGSNSRPCIYETVSLTIQSTQRWIGSTVSDACSATPHKACSHSFSVPEISGMINSCGIPVEMAVKLQRPHSIPHAKIHRQPWPFCASAANATLSSWVRKLKDQCDFAGIKLPWRAPRLLFVLVCGQYVYKWTFNNEALRWSDWIRSV